MSQRTLLIVFHSRTGGAEQMARAAQAEALQEAGVDVRLLPATQAQVDDVLAAHRVPPQLMGIIPHNTGGFGDASKAAEVFYQNEIWPLQTRVQEINDRVGEEVVTFGPYALGASSSSE